MGSGYKINEDGTVTKIKSSDRKKGDHNNGSGGSGKRWLIWLIIIGVGALIFGVAKCSSSDSYTDDSDDNYIEDDYVEYSNATYLDLSTTSLYVPADGGELSVDISTDGNWEVDVHPESWGQVTVYDNSISISFDSNPYSSQRVDYMVIRAGDIKQTIDIVQSGDTSPKGNIEDVWMTHNVYKNGEKGMDIHVKFTVDNMNGETVYVYFPFYWGDNTSPLHDRFDNPLEFYQTGVPAYNNARFDDFVIFIPYSGLNMSPGIGTVEISFDVVVKSASDLLDRSENHQLTFSN